MESYLTAEISPSAVQANINLMRASLAPGVKMCPAVKADCYGLGVGQLARAIEEVSDWLAVATPNEAINLRQLGCTKPVLTLFAPLAGSESIPTHDLLCEQISLGITLTLTSHDALRATAECASKVGGEAQVHVMIDTGMHRSGVAMADAPALIDEIRKSGGVKLTGLYTHFATSDEADKAYSRLQFERFGQIVKAVGGGEGLILHAANSGATIDLPEMQLDMVRPGIAVYGYQPSDEMHNRPALRPALRLWGRLMQVREISTGERCGYGQTHEFAEAGRIGLVPIGYADGYKRTLSNNATMRIRGRDVPVRGRVSMDQTIIDLTDLPDAEVGDEVEILSNDPAAPHSVENIARLAGTIPNEIITGLGKRARKVLVD